MFCLYVWNIWIKTDHIHIEVLVLILIFLLTREYLANKVTYPPILLVFYNKTVMKTRRVIIRHSSYCSGISLGLPCVRSVLRCYHTGTTTTVIDWTIPSRVYWKRRNRIGWTYNLYVPWQNNRVLLQFPTVLFRHCNSQIFCRIVAAHW